MLAGVDSNLYSSDEDDEEEGEDDAGKGGSGSVSGGIERRESKDGEGKGKGKERASTSQEPPPKEKKAKPVGRAMRDFSVVYSTSRKRNELFLGPARFLNVSSTPISPSPIHLVFLSLLSIYPFSGIG